MTGPAPLVTILMATFNGAAFLGDQLASIAGQSHRNWRLRVSDDGSTDGTLSLLETFLADPGAGNVLVSKGPMRGATANFLSLLETTCDDDGSIAFCDQDDIWLSEKLERAVAMIGGADGAALYGCRAVIADAAGEGESLAPLPRRDLGFGHALAENAFSGNGIVMNAAAAALLRRAIAGAANRAVIEAGFHDWWAYQVISAAGGRIMFDPVPGLRYRQHAGNVVGSGQAKGRGLSRIFRAFWGGYAASLRLQALALTSSAGLLPEQMARAAALLSLRDIWVWQRPKVIRWIGIYRQRRAEDLVLKLLLLLGRV